MQKKSMSSGVKNWATVGKQQMCQHSVWQRVFFFSPLLKDQTTTVILLDNFQIAQRAERDSMQHIFILISCQIASVSHQFQKAKEDLKWKQSFTRNWKGSVRSLCEWFRLVFTRSLRKVIWDGGDGVWKREKLTFHSEIFLLPPKGTSPLHNR